MNGIPSKIKTGGIREYKNIDWSRSKAYFSPKHFAFPWIGIEINLKNKKTMPFKSEKQRKFLWANEPEIAKKWTAKYGSNPVKKILHKKRKALFLKSFARLLKPKIKKTLLVY